MDAGATGGVKDDTLGTGFFVGLGFKTVVELLTGFFSRERVKSVRSGTVRVRGLSRFWGKIDMLLMYRKSVQRLTR